MVIWFRGALHMAADGRSVASAPARQAEWNAIFNLALVAAYPGRGVIMVPGMIVIRALTVPGHG